jgi:hypothetical protein
VAYNNLWDTGYIGQVNRPRPGIWFEPDEGWLEWRMYDGGMPELYDNDWQPSKTDHTPHSPQIEAMNYYSAQARIFERDPEFYWSTIVWDGGPMNHSFRGRRATSKPFYYATRGQRWDFDRYEGWVQFTLWTTRPRTMREFRGGPKRGAYYDGAWMAVLRSVDRPWNHPVLREFWRFGQLVPNPAEEHPWQLGEEQPQWVRDLERWYLLSCDANPPRETWTGNTTIRVFALALKLGEAPRRRWLIYAHAPRGAVAGPTVQFPGSGPVKLRSVPRSGSFFLFEEARKEESVEALIAGGPAELSLVVDRKYARVGEKVRFDAAVTHAPEQAFTRFAWTLGDSHTLKQGVLAGVEHAFREPGEYLVTVEGHRQGAASVVEQAVVYVGEPPEESVLYDLPLNEAFAWEGPWNQVGESEERLLTYRHLPNRGRLPDAVLVGGEFVDDPERGRVLELAGDQQQGVWLIRNRDTVMEDQGDPNRTLSLCFKAADLDGRQMLYTEGHHLLGFNVYLDGRTLYAGSWAPVDGQIFGTSPVRGRNWDGHWLKQEGIEPGVWYHVVLMLKDATLEVEKDKQHLFVNGTRVDMGPGVRIPRSYGAPCLGHPPRHSWSRGGDVITKFHDGNEDEHEIRPFHGRIDDFRWTNTAP